MRLASWSPVTPKNPECTSMNFAIAASCVIGHGLVGRSVRRDSIPADGPVIGRMTDDRRTAVPYTPMTMHATPRLVRCPLLDRARRPARARRSTPRGRRRRPRPVPAARRPGGHRQDAVPRRDQPEGGGARLPVDGGAVAPQDHDVPAASILDMARSMLRVPAFATLGRASCSSSTRGRRVGRTHPPPPVRDRDRSSSSWRRCRARRCCRSRTSTGPTTSASRSSPSWPAGRATRKLLITGDYRTEEVPRGTNLRAWRSRLITQRIAEELRLAPLDSSRDRPGHDAPARHRAACPARRGRCRL